MKYRNIGIYKITALSVIGASAVLSLIRYSTLIDNIELANLDIDSAYFITRTFETIWFVLFAAFFAVLSIFTAVIIGRKADKFIDTEASPVVFSSALCGFMLLSTGLYYVYYYFIVKDIGIPNLIISLLSLPVAAVFLYLSIAKDGVKNKLVPFLRLIPVVYIITRLLIDFIKQNSMPSNSAVCFHIISLVSLMLFMIYEGKSSFLAVNMRLYLCTGYLSIMFLLLYAVPNLIITIFHYPQLDKCILFSAVDIVFAIYVFTRVYSVTKLTKAQK